MLSLSVFLLPTYDVIFNPFHYIVFFKCSDILKQTTLKKSPAHLNTNVVLVI